MPHSEFIQLLNDVQRASGLLGGEISFPLLPVLSIKQFASGDPLPCEPQLLPTGQVTHGEQVARDFEDQYW